MEEKTCPGCGETRPLEAFYKNSRSKDGRQARCKQCQLQYQKDNKDKVNARVTAWRRRKGVPPRKGKKLGGPGTLFPNMEE